MTDKERVDVALVKRGLCESRERAQAAIMAGLVYRGENKVRKASETVTPAERLNTRENAIRRANTFFMSMMNQSFLVLTQERLIPAD